jgi:hypothetical protein
MPLIYFELLHALLTCTAFDGMAKLKLKYEVDRLLWLACRLLCTSIRVSGFPQVSG